MKMKILVSACLLGENCKYNGGNNKNDDVIALAEKFELIPVCPECFGGLPIPRTPAEIKQGGVYSKNGEDWTQYFKNGAEHTLYIAKESNCPVAVLKERSPSCGCGKIYDGTFSGALVDGNGITADLLMQNDIQVFGESQIKKVIDLYYWD
jgi:uncharacterized protein YbbK (DUF523 family)